MTAKKQNKSRVSRKTRVVLLVSVLLMLTISVIGSIAYLVDNTDALENIFTPTSVPIEVAEEFDGNVKKNVQITNTGNTDAYIRAAVIVTWVDKDGNISGIVPVEKTDYTINRTLDGWERGEDGYYYHLEKVPFGNSTGVLFTECKPLISKDGYQLSVEIVAQSIQANGVDEKGTPAVTLAWGVGVNENGSLNVQ